ncbi:pleckstrin [Falco biarmicus]|uniref:Pleckstrin n=2 Tax=Falconidae TaxID=8949 RepID=A0A8C4U4Y1_FALTI|nr:pleckstrin [Falco peregrinus]XP_005439225.1 pleckstrin [Falco cherrug]XP_037248014.1 pleckstrin [Falco rusticolus]XP_040453488.1 pleckstrin [Falco naumanni]XP_040453489.1 pleckstrin [Falco naumanni]XP_056198787.1 pleckstrin [Falco biarmicus]
MEREPMRIREGYLVKKGSMFNTWKPMWVVLLEDGIEFYKRKADNSPKGMIPLKGSSINSPCQDFGKRMFVFKLTAAKQQDHFFQAAYLEERDAWVRDIKKAIHCIDGGQRFARKSTRRSIRLPETINLSALYLSMKDPEKGIKELKLEKDKKVFNHCFTGTSVIDWLVSSKSIRNRKEGLMLASSLLSEGYLQPAGDTSKAAAEGLSDTPFLDLSDAYYYFPDSGFFCEGNSSDDDVVLKEEFRGIVVKQGCLLKQGHRRKNWKVRKFVLREDPAYLHYYDPAGGEEPLGAIHLRGCVVTAVEDMPDTKKYDVDNILFEIITANEIHYYLQAASSAERTEWIKAIQAVSRTGK